MTKYTRLFSSTLFVVLAGFLIASCGSKAKQEESTVFTLKTGEWKVGLAHPESVTFDGTSFYVSDFGDMFAPHLKDGKGRIAQIDTSGKVISENIAKTLLHKPKGLIVIGSTLLVADIDSLKAIDKQTGELLYGIGFNDVGVKFDVAGQIGLNDVVKGNSDSIVYVSLTSNGKIYQVHLPSKTKTEIASVPMANGIAYDSTHNVLYAGGYTNQPSLSKIELSNQNATNLVPNGYVGKGGLDGMTVIGDKLYISDWGAGATGANEVGIVLKYNLSTQSSEELSLATSIGKAHINGPADFVIVGNYIVIPSLGGGNIYVVNK